MFDYDLIVLMVIFLGFFTMIVLSFYFYFKARNSERMALIEKSGGDLSIFDKRPSKEPNGPMGLKIGIFLVGVSIGLLTAFILSTFLPIPGVVIYCSMILLFGGLSLILYYPLSAKYFKK